MINLAGVVSIVLFYLLILAVGIWAGRKKEEGNDSEEEVMLAGRSIGLFVGIFTMTGNFNCNSKILKPKENAKQSNRRRKMDERLSGKVLKNRFTPLSIMPKRVSNE